MPDQYAHPVLWTISEFCYYLGLICAAALVPAITFSLWILSFVDKASPNYLYLLIAWVISVLVFLLGVKIKNRLR